MKWRPLHSGRHWGLFPPHRACSPEAVHGPHGVRVDFPLPFQDTCWRRRPSFSTRGARSPALKGRTCRAEVRSIRDVSGAGPSVVRENTSAHYLSPSLPLSLALFFLFLNKVLTLDVFSWGKILQGLTFVQILTVKYRFILYLFMKMELEAANAFI